MISFVERCQHDLTDWESEVFEDVSWVVFCDKSVINEAKCYDLHLANMEIC